MSQVQYQALFSCANNDGIFQIRMGNWKVNICETNNVTAFNSWKIVWDNTTYQPIIVSLIPPDHVRREPHLNNPWFQASAAMFMRSAFFWGITQRRVVILYRRFGTTYRSHFEGSRSPRWTDRLSRNFNITTRRSVIPQKSADFLM
jgi:hypothetical protein